MRRLVTILVAVLAITVMTAGIAFAAPNPAGTGQPGVPNGADCAAVSMAPPGFGTDGFANAGLHYAGSPGTPSLEHANSPHAISQYDIACYQYTLNHS